MAKKDLQQLQTIKERMIVAGIPEDEVNALVDPLKNELQRRVCGLVWEHTTTSIPDMEGKIPALTPVTGKSIVNNIKGDNHVLIEGENLLALMAMQYTHIDENGKGMIDVIYIDPPYNTGSVSFAYNDKFEKSEWLSMMDIRLKLARNLLKDDGVIFISIDETYQAELKMLCYEVFRQPNVEEMVWKEESLVNGTRSGKMKASPRFRIDHEYIVVCYKNKTASTFRKVMAYSKVTQEYGNADNDPRGNWISCDTCQSAEKSKPNGKNYYSYTTPGGAVYSRQWYFTRDELDALVADNRIYFGKTGNNVPRLKKFLSEKRPITQGSILDDVGSSADGRRTLAQIFGVGEKEAESLFPYPKPVTLISRLLDLANKPNAIVLDFFAGTGTTGHAVLDLNKEDGGHRQFILCTNNELGKDALKTAKKNGYVAGSEEYEALGVCHAVTYPRMQNIFPDYPGNNLYYYRIDQNIAESAIDDVTIANMASRAVFYVAMKENVYNAEQHDDYYLLYNDKTDIAVVTDPDMDMFDVEDEIVPTAFTREHRKVYCSVYESCMRNGIEYIPYPKEVLDVLKAAKKYIRREAA